MNEIQTYASEGIINAESLLWYEGLEDWSPASHFSDIAPYLPTVAETTQANPYAAPETNVTAGGIQLANGEFSFPPVKRVSYGKYLGLLVGGILIGFIGVMMISSSAPSTSEMTDEQLLQEFARPLESEQNGEFASPSYGSSAPMSGAGIGGLVLVIVGGGIWLSGIIYGYLMLYRAWFAIQPGGARTTPGKAVGFLFIPVFNIYWNFVAFPGWADHWNRIKANHGNLAAAPAVSYGIFITAPILALCSAIPILGFLIFPVSIIFSLISRYQMSNVINFIASSHSQQQMKQGGGGLKLY